MFPDEKLDSFFLRQLTPQKASENFEEYAI